MNIIMSVLFPIIAYMGIPGDKSTDETFRDFKNAGFDICITNYFNINDAVNALKVANRHGIKIIPRCVDYDNRPLEAVSKLKDYPSLYGYLVCDEPDWNRMMQLKDVINGIKSINPSLVSYVNLLPYYGPEILRQTKTKDYVSYVQGLSELSISQVSFDYYPITNNGIRKSWYENLEIIMSESKKLGLPFWGFVLSTPHFVYPQPTMGSLRLQVYANLAYGAKGIQYYTYWTPKAHDNYDYHDGPISYTGEKTKTYSLVKSMNMELNKVSRLFVGASIDSVRHLLDIPQGAIRLSSPPKNIKSIKVKGRYGAIVSCFKKANSHYMAIVNKDYEQSLVVQIKANNSIPVRITKELKSVKLSNLYSIAEGDILIIKLD